MIVQHTIAQESFINNANFLDSIKNTSVKLNETDSNFIIKNSTNVDVVKYKIAENQMEAEVKYKAEDSIIYQIEEKNHVFIWKFLY
jgi:hypothetical protein